MQEPLRIFCRGTPQFPGGQSWWNGSGFDAFKLNNRELGYLGARPRFLAPRGAADGSRANGGNEDQPQLGPLTDPSEWLRVEAAAVLGTLRPLPPLRMMKLNVEFALMWVDVADRPDVLDLGRVLGSEGAGDALCYWSYAQGRAGESVCVLAIVLLRPVRATFAIPFSFADTQQILAGILRARSLVLCFGTPPQEVSVLEPMRDARTLYELATTPSRETISIEFDGAAYQDLQSKLLQWARGGVWEA